MGRLHYGCSTILVACASLAPCSLQSQSPSVSQTVEEELHHMSDLAGIIFVGEVTAVRHRAGEAGASGVVEVDFRIDQAIRGCQSGGTYTLREWAGLWMGGDERYRLGQRLLLLLHSPGATGITSPVEGMNGAIPVRPTGPASLATASASTTAPSSLIVDLRWVGTRLQRPALAPSSPLVTAQGEPSVSDTSMAAQQATVEVVTGMLRSWQQAAP